MANFVGNIISIIIYVIIAIMVLAFLFPFIMLAFSLATKFVSEPNNNFLSKVWYFVKVGLIGLIILILLYMGFRFIQAIFGDGIKPE